MENTPSVQSMVGGASTNSCAPGPQSTHAFKPPRACEGCRSLKVQCVFDSSQPTTCRRCIKARRRCVVTERRRRRIAESSVADIEKKLRALNADLQAVESKLDFAKAPPEIPGSGEMHSDSQKSYGTSPVPMTNLYEASTVSFRIEGELTLKSETHDRQKITLPAVFSAANSRVPQEASSIARRPSLQHGDVIDQGLLTTQTAFDAFDHFISNMLVQFPIVVLPHETDIAGIRRTKPVLFLAVLCAACGKFPPSVQRQVNEELMAVFADRIIRIGEKSLELIQALQIALIWYYPPGRYEELKYYQLVCIL